ncbi:MAG: A/G-specific adenine glycosylase [Myxococcaceae bacterium]|nr:A/G-specific adenine glycosylase [Myxococcaceae bacterium]MBH2005844.1 A/G-specific adenine glycosylase [Myxococcaceae bacterium]
MIFFDKLVSWFQANQRDLPWRHDRTPYRVWLSEIMLQQTQVSTVLDYYKRFTERFPTVQDLAKAHEDDVLALWSGLGYYSRARNLHRCAQIIESRYQGLFPTHASELSQLPGIGSYTAGAIVAFAYNQPSAVVDGNIARVFSRLYNDETPWGDSTGKKHFEQMSLELAQEAPDCRLWQESLMELGALVCKPTHPDCHHCPLLSGCRAHQQQNIPERPVKLLKTQKSRLDRVCALVHTSDAIWLEKNQQDLLFKGLYAPPNALSSPRSLEEDFQTLTRTLELKNKSCGSFISIERTLSHRNLHLHAKVISMKNAVPKGHWILKSDLRKVGLSAAFKALLLKAGLLCWVLSGPVACVHNRPSIRYIRQAIPAAPTTDAVSYARSLIGQKAAQWNGKTYRADCSGTVRAIYDAAGWPLGNAEGTKAIYKVVKDSGQIFSKNPKPGDLIFFHTGNQPKSLNHIGFVEAIQPDQTILLIHHMSGLIVRSRMNLNYPNLQISPKDKTRLNHILRRSGNGKSYTAAEVFDSFGRIL